MNNDQIGCATELRNLIKTPDAFLLPEVWDVASARVIGDAGFRAIGTSASAIAWSNGYKSHERVKLEELLVVAARVARGARLPVNADLEGGMDRSVGDVKRSVQAAIAIGCAGVTIGDGSRNGAHGVMSIDEMSSRIRAARVAAMEANIPIVITARTETFHLGPFGTSPFQTAIERGAAYMEAGADCVLVSGVEHIQIVERLVHTMSGPLAISIAVSAAPNLDAYSAAGVACVTLGTSLLRSLLGNLRVKVHELASFGHFAHLDRAIPQDELEELLR